MPEIKEIAVFRSPLEGKFGVPRQSGLAPSLTGEIHMLPPYNAEEALRGLDGFGYIWLIWGFSLNPQGESAAKLTVRPPRLGGNRRVGVFASRSPFRPNGLGLSSVRVISVKDGIITVSGADLADGTPIYDIKPYLPYADSHPDAAAGFTAENAWQQLRVVIPEEVSKHLSDSELQALREVLCQDPRPRYQDDSERSYGLLFAGHNIRFRVDCDVLTVESVS